ncbi:hypothetical protein PYCC9005_003856 [Savitreella phatthalungensis]
MSVLIIPTLKFQPGKVDAALDLLRSEMFPYTEAESENSSYAFFRGADDETSSTVRAFEEYDSASATETHAQSSELAAFGKKLGELGYVAPGGVDLKFYLPYYGFAARKENLNGKGGRWDVPAGKFVWLARLNFKDGAARASVLERAKELVNYVYKEEKTTHSYLFTTNRDDDTEVLVFEVYEDKKALTDIHSTSEPFKQFFAWVKSQDVLTGRDVVGYTTIENAGWIAKDGKNADHF